MCGYGTELSSTTFTELYGTIWRSGVERERVCINVNLILPLFLDAAMKVGKTEWMDEWKSEEAISAAKLSRVKRRIVRKYPVPRKRAK